MSTIYQFPIPIPMTNGSFPQFKFAVFGDGLSSITTAGYLNSLGNEGGPPLSNSDVIMALYSFNQQTNSGTFGIFTVNILASNGKITLTEWANSGDAVLPTTPFYLAHFTNTVGTISSQMANVTNLGNIQAGLSGTVAGEFIAAPILPNAGFLALSATSNSAGNFSNTITNSSSIGQTQIISIPDSGVGMPNFILSDNASTQHITTGSLEVDKGNVTAGSNGNAGDFVSFPGAANQGTLSLIANTNSAGNFSTMLKTAPSVAQNQNVLIPDVGAATGYVLAANSLLTVGNLPKAATTTGQMVDSGIAASGIQLSSNIKAGKVLTLGGAGAGPLTFTVTGLLAASSIANVNVFFTTNPAYIIAASVSSNDHVSITFNTDPGAVAEVTYVAFVVPQ